MQGHVENNNSQDSALPSQTLEVVAKSFYKQALEYGFTREDFIRYVNILLDLGLGKRGVYEPPPSVKPAAEVSLPISNGQEEQIAVRLFEEADLPLLKQWLTDAVGQQFLTTRPEPIQFETLDALLMSDTSRFGVVSLNDKPIGALAYLNIDPVQKKAELRKLIGDPAARGHGYAKRATQYWIEYGVSTLGLRKIYVNTLDTNLANIRLNEQLGFRVEGLLRDEILLDGQYQDVLRMSLILP